MTGGELEEGGEDKKTRWESRIINVPTEGVSFEVGRYKVHREEIDGVTLRVGILKSGDRIDTSLFEQTVSGVREAFTLMQSLFGGYPLNELTVVTGWREASEAHLGFVVLDNSLVEAQRYSILPWIIERERLEILTHEIAHQWWGHKLGVMNYRDMWLGEALADFSVYLAYHGPLGKDPAGRRALARRARATLSGVTGNGQPRDSLGPIVLGPRLNSSLDDHAYQSIVYDKGFLALSTLAVELGDEPFLEMLKTLVDSVDFGVIDTKTFFAAMERMSGRDLDPFVRRFIFGTGIPTVLYEYEVKQDATGSWTIEVDVRQSQVEYGGAQLIHTGAGGWDAIKYFEDRLEADNSRLILPYAYTYDGPEDGSLHVARGRLVLDGSSLSIYLHPEGEPTDFRVDPERRVLAFLYREGSSEQTALEVRASRSVAERRYDEAITLYREALVIEEGQEPNDYLRYRLHLTIAGIYLDMGMDELAKAELERADELLSRKERILWRRTVLETRLALRAGDYETVYATLSDRMRLPFRQRGDASTVQQFRRSKFKDGIWGDGQTYAMLAISAHFTGHAAVCRRAMDEAISRGAIMSQLEGLHRD
jgi:tetratricopeptide (TPR) repeat protein